MKTFENIQFNGTFRDYQARIIDRLDSYFHDNKINIVAAPGSGKTILGLEIIRKLDNPCIIFSPTTTIRNQWGDRFEQNFLPIDLSAEEFISFDLNSIKPITSITYQALYSAISKVKCKTEDEQVDYSNIDLFKLIKQNGIKTICLDEAHHLQNEWQKALETFIKGLDKNIKIISLTATPPYDASPAEWKRYNEICGEIDEEIFIPELVKQNNLCPHQDYIYFNFPTKEEVNEFQDYKQKIVNALETVKDLPFIETLTNKIDELYRLGDEMIYANVHQIVSIMVLLDYFGYIPNLAIVKALTTKRTLPNFKLEFAEIALQFLLESSKLLSEEEKDELLKVLKSNGIIDKNKVELDLNATLKRKLISSMGKLESIKQIAKCESNCLGEKLRMLILTDYIKKESVKEIGTNKKFNNISVVSIFENLRKEKLNCNIAVLSGSLIILPENIFSELKKQNIKYTSEKIANTGYQSVNFKATNREKVNIVGKLFETGKIQILIGTKSLLGEGWDSPCINSLILASFVGSFMLSNQMRGRAIRIDKNNPDKTANIWHLVTVEPEYLIQGRRLTLEEKEMFNAKKYLNSCDFKVLERRFESFIGPNYETGKIESGIERVSIIKPPYDKDGIENINEQMKEISAERAHLKEVWQNALADTGKTAITSEVPKEKRVPNATTNIFGIVNLIITLLVTTLEISYIKICTNSATSENVLLLILFTILFIFFLYLTYKLTYKIISHISPHQSIKTLCKCLLKTLKDIDVIESDAHLKVKSYSDIFFDVMLTNATVYEQNIFNTAVKEIYSVIENPRYLIIKQKRNKKYNYSQSFACPNIIGQKKENVEILAHYLEKSMGKMKLVYTRNEQGRKLILKCRKHSYITFNERCVNKKFKVVNYE